MLVFHTLWLLLGITIVQCQNQTMVAMPRIIGGYISSIKEEKYLVQVTTAEELCGGSLVRPSWVMTAAHCIKGVNIGELRIYGGASNLNGPNAVLRLVNFATIHPRFSTRTLNMDVAALRLRQPMVGTNIEVIELATSLPPPRTLVKVSGWGVLSTQSESPAKRVHSVTVPIWSRSACKKIYRKFRRISKSMICAAKPLLRDSCQGDSGGPLVFKDQLIGVVSWGYSCAKQLPGVYTSVPVIRKWFLNVVKQNS